MLFWGLRQIQCHGFPHLRYLLSSPSLPHVVHNVSSICSSYSFSPSPSLFFSFFPSIPVLKTIMTFHLLPLFLCPFHPFILLILEVSFFNVNRIKHLSYYRITVKSNHFSFPSPIRNMTMWVINWYLCWMLKLNYHWNYVLLSCLRSWEITILTANLNLLKQNHNLSRLSWSRTRLFCLILSTALVYFSLSLYIYIFYYYFFFLSKQVAKPGLIQIFV